MVVSCDTESNTASPDGNYFMKLYGGDGDQSGVDMVFLDDGSFLLLGNSEFAGVKKIYLVKVDSKGKITWEKKYGNTTDEAKDIEPTGNGNFVILSNFLNPVNDSTDIKLTRIRGDGSKIDSVMYGSSKDDNAQSVTPLLDGGFIVTGWTHYDTSKFKRVDPNLYSNIFHFRCNANFQFDKATWREFDGAIDKVDVGNKVIQATDGSFYVFGYSDLRFDSAQLEKLNLVYGSISPTGIPLDRKFLGRPELDARSSFVCEVPAALGGGIVLIGTTAKSNGESVIHLSRLRTPLYFNRSNDVGIDEDISISGISLDGISASPAVAGSKGFILLANETRTSGTNIWLTKVDQSAILQWSVSLGSEESNDTGSAVRELPDGKIVVLGTIGIRNGQSKMALFKLNSNGRLQD